MPNRRTRFLLFTTVLWASLTPPPTNAQTSRSLHLTYHSQKLNVALEEFQQASGIRLVYSNTLVDSFRVTARIQDPPHRALKKILIATPLDFIRESPKLWVIVPRSQTRELPVELHGRILDAETNQAISDANVVSVTAVRGTTTDANGRYSLQGLPPGRHNVRVERIGFAPLETEIIIPPNDRRRQDLLLRSRPVATPEIVVEDLRILTPRRQTLTQQHIGRRELTLPPIRNDGEIFELLHQLPGVSRRDVDDVFPHIEGGAATEVAIELDGIPIYVPTYGYNHRSVFAAPTVAGLTLHRAGYGVEHGEAMSGVVEVHSHDIRSLPYSAYSSASLSGVAVNFKKNSDKIGWTGMWRSGLSVDQLNFSGFRGHDLFNKVQYQLAPNKRLTFLSLFSLGHFQQSNALETNRILSHNLGLRYDVVTKSGQTLAFIIYRSALEQRQQESGFKLRLQQPLASHLRLKTGLELLRLTSTGTVSLDSLSSYKLLQDGLLNPEATTPTPDLFNHQTSVMTPYLGLEYEQQPLRVRAGLRLPTDLLTKTTRFEPRVNLTMSPIHKIDVSLAAGRYYQFTDRSYASEVKSGDQFGSGEFLKKIATPPSYSDHVRGEIACDLSNNINLSVAYFHKRYHFYDQGYFARINHWTWLLPLKNGTSQGLELWLERTGGPLQGWISYTFNPQSFGDDSGAAFRPYFNREHIFNLSVLHYLKKGWMFKGQFLSTSGYPYRHWDPDEFKINPDMSAGKFVQQYFSGAANSGALRQIAVGLSRTVPGLAKKSTVNLIAVYSLEETQPRSVFESDIDFWLSLNLAF